MALQTDLQLLRSHPCPSLSPPSLLNLYLTFRLQVEREHHPGLVIARGGTIMAAIKDTPELLLAQIDLVTVLFGFVPAACLSCWHCDGVVSAIHT